MQIPVYDAHNNIVSVEEFTPNLDLHGTPAYKNEGCSMGLTRVTSGKYKGVLAILYNNEITPSGNYGVLISDHEAWELCQNRGKVHLIEELQIEWNRGII